MVTTSPADDPDVVITDVVHHAFAKQGHALDGETVRTHLEGRNEATSFACATAVLGSAS